MPEVIALDTWYNHLLFLKGFYVSAVMTFQAVWMIILVVSHNSSKLDVHTSIVALPVGASFMT